MKRKETGKKYVSKNPIHRDVRLDRIKAGNKDRKAILVSQLSRDKRGYYNTVEPAIRKNPSKKLKIIEAMQMKQGAMNNLLRRLSTEAGKERRRMKPTKELTSKDIQHLSKRAKHYIGRRVAP